MRRLLREPLIIVENVAQYPESILVEYLGDLYTIEVVIVDAATVWPQRRIRKFILLRLKANVDSSYVAPALQSWLDSHKRDLQLTWRDLMVAERAELMSELEWAWNKAKFDCPIVFDAPSAFYDCLTDTEKEYLASYKILHPARRSTPSLAAYSLSQDPSSGYNMLSTCNCLHTLIKNTGLIWVPAVPPHTVGRWLTPTECLWMQGFLFLFLHIIVSFVCLC